MEKIWKIVIAVILGVVAAAYIGGAYFFSTHLFPNTTVDGMEAGRETPDQAVEKLEKALGSSTVTVSSFGETCSLPGNEVLKITNAQAAAAALQDRDWYAWPYEVFQNHPLTTGKNISCDPEQLKKKLEASTVFKVSKVPVDAKISDFQTGVGYTILPDEDGYRVNEDDALSYIAAELNQGHYDIDLTGRYAVKAERTKDDAELNSRLAALNKVINHNITISVQGESMALNGDTLHQWVIAGEDGMPVIDPMEINRYSDQMQQTFADKFAGMQAVTGFQYLVDAGQLADILNKKLTFADDATASDAIELPVLEADPAFQPQFGLNYIDVDIQNQQVKVFRDAKVLMQTSCVTGLPTKDRSTHPGVFRINYKQRDRILKGPPVNGVPSYQSHVSYWMPFDGGRGLHDASWRGKFGGNIYRYGGSHGCVNLPTSFAKNLYEVCSVGECVWVH